MNSAPPPPCRRLRSVRRVLGGALLAFGLSAAGASAATDPLWPQITPTARPWTRWWWPGSAVDAAGLTGQLAQFQTAGLGGVEITPIYGALGAEARSIDFLSDTWMERLRFAATEARRLGLGVDMATGTGWPFGGPWVPPADGSQRLALVDGRLAGQPTGMQVKRAAPGGAGLVLDPFSPAALARYLAPFSVQLGKIPRGLWRAQFHDSFEYYQAEWTPQLDTAFRQQHGYELEHHATELTGQRSLPADQLGRLKADYRATLASLHLDYLKTWAAWSHAHGGLVRNQSHGAPANLLDLYGAVDIAETETFGSTPFPIPGLRREARDVRSDQDLPEPIVLRFASSAAHVTGHPLVSSESCTWLREHWKEALAFAKPELDQLFVNGINHVFYHGTVYSPPDAPWPGWLFYASTQFNPANPWWDDFAALNAYVARVQSVLQTGQPDNDVLLYWPFADVLDQPEGLTRLLTVHDVRWATDSAFGRAATQLAAAGFCVDYVSDAQLLASEPAAGGGLRTPGHDYRVLVIPAVRRMPVETLEKLVALARSGVAVHLLAWPEDVPGLGRLEERRARFQSLLTELRKLALSSHHAVYAGPAVDGAALNITALGQLARREPLAQHGLRFVRRAAAHGSDYFIANLGAQRVDRWVPLGTPARAASLLDPLTGRAGRAALRSAAGVSEIYLQLDPGQSLLVRTCTDAHGPLAAEPWLYITTAAGPEPLTGEWRVEFLHGGPALPAPFASRELRSWTELGGPAAQAFAGTARYRLEFELPAAPAGVTDWLLDLGDVRESARVRLNGLALATAWSVPFRLQVGPALRPGRNVLEVDVTNLAANRIRDLDRRGIHWRIMREINFVNVRYQPFDASGWDLTPSGLLGPVTLTPLLPLAPE